MGRISKGFIIKGFALLLCAVFAAGCDGKAEELSTGTFLGDPSLVDGGTRTDGSDQGQLYTVTKIVEATPEISEWLNSDLPFTGPRRALGDPTLNSQWPFKYEFTYPPNNYAIGDARILLATKRDASDTEGIFVDGVLTGYPPTGSPSPSSPKILYRNYTCALGACTGGAVPTGTPNLYYMDFALTHYKINLPNTFDLSLSELLKFTPLTISGILADGILRVVSGDDAVIYPDSAPDETSRPLLFMEGFTISKTPLVCAQSPIYKIVNTYIHNDGNSIAATAFSGSVVTPSASYAANYTTFRSVEFFYDPKLPKLASYTNLNITVSNIAMQVKRTNAGPTAIVINGIGFDQDGFDRTTATSAVESWSTDAAARAYWNTFVTTVPATNVSTNATLNLLSLFNAAKVKELLLQGKLNVAIAGPLASVYGQAATSGRTYGVAVNGPDLALKGTYSAEICDVPDNATSPLNGGMTGPTSCTTDFASPTISSVQVTSITSTSAKVQWLTNEGSSSQVGYGVTAPTTLTVDNTTPVTFHSVDITGLQPYKFYQYNVRSTDGCTNSATSATKSFRTLR